MVLMTCRTIWVCTCTFLGCTTANDTQSRDHPKDRTNRVQTVYFLGQDVRQH
jgi:hypothetical protein